MGKKAVSYLLYIFTIVFTAGLLVMAVLSWRATFISPLQGGLWTTVALLMPVILFANVVAAIWWLVRRKWLVAVMPVAALLINMNYVAASIRLPDPEGDHHPKCGLRVATLNVDGFRRYQQRTTSTYGMSDLIEQESVDVFCMQEFLDDNVVTGDSIAAYFAARMPYFVREKGEAIVSVFPILNHGYVGFPGTNNDYLWGDLLVGTDTIRVVTIHLQTTGISTLQDLYWRAYRRKMPFLMMFPEVARNTKLRMPQVDEICNLVDTTHYPVIVVGDCNDTPSSYTYRRMTERLVDGFMTCGHGYGATFRGVGGFLRIDYIFHSKEVECVHYYLPDKDVSDHKTVIADLKFK
ncbi:MAG: endonuclease/exonuclease/phosphatase family protein [Alistipes sp.]